MSSTSLRHPVEMREMDQAAIAPQRRMVADPAVHGKGDRQACLYAAAMLRGAGRLPADLARLDAMVEHGTTVVFLVADASQREVARFVLPSSALPAPPKLRQLAAPSSDPASYEPASSEPATCD